MSVHLSKYSSHVDEQSVLTRIQQRMKEMKETKKDNESYFETIMLRKGVFSTESADNLEYILTEYFGVQIKSMDHDKCFFEEVYKLSPDSSQLIGQLLIEKMFAAEEEVPSGF
uniref:DUF4476 domain-containing protein n=1 Tax=Rhabditophanes sp. KR3021 TaxID=114890 RepID=A0AC35TNC6_9BILA